MITVKYRGEGPVFKQDGNTAGKDMLKAEKLKLLSGEVVEIDSKWKSALNPDSVEMVKKAKAETSDTKKPKKELKVKIGIMEATVDAGPDGEFGTNDDKVTVKRKAKK
jgi:hypothetical protein